MKIGDVVIVSEFYIGSGDNPRYFKNVFGVIVGVTPDGFEVQMSLCDDEDDITLSFEENELTPDDNGDAYLFGEPPVYASQEEFDADHWAYNPLPDSGDDGPTSEDMGY